MTARQKRILKRCALGAVCALWLAFVFSNSLRSMAASARQSAFAEDLVRRVLSSLGFSGNIGHAAEIIARKGAHVFEFFVLFILAALLFSTLLEKQKNVVMTAFALSFAFASADELLQLASKRGAAFGDVLIDACGAALGALTYTLFSRLLKHRRRRG